jgi:Fe-S cluster biogenesis protein NfuA/nitrite reductase/ring-hydroxylating ferredoxin subunit
MNDRETRERVARVETLLAEVEELDEPARSLAGDAVAALVDLYGEALARLVAAGAVGEEVLDDELVSHLLLVHELHPVDVQTRVARALEEVRPYLGSHGGDVELLGVDDGVARLRLAGSCDGCPSSAATLKLAIEDAILKAAPDVERVEAEGVAEPASAGNGLIQLGSFSGNGGGASAAPADWTVVGALSQLRDGDVVVKEVAGEAVCFLRVDGTFYGYRDSCASCSESLAGAGLAAGELTCSTCGRGFDVRRAGRCLDVPQLALEPVPLLVGEAGLVKVAIPAAVA